MKHLLLLVVSRQYQYYYFKSDKLELVKTVRWINVALRGIMETGIVIAFGYWGFHAGNSMAIRITLAIITPLVGFGFWGLVDFHKAGMYAETLRLVQELVISGLASIALYVKGAQSLGLALAILSIIYHLLVYLIGDRLLKNK